MIEDSAMAVSMVAASSGERSEREDRLTLIGTAGSSRPASRHRVLMQGAPQAIHAVARPHLAVLTQHGPQPIGSLRVLPYYEQS